MHVEERTAEQLDAATCLDLARSLSVGRLAVAVDGEAPLVVPVNYVLDGDVVVFRSDHGTKLVAARSQPVSFEVDYIDLVHQAGWSVLIRGRAYVATHWEVEHLDLEPWVAGDKSQWVRLVPSSITGRRIRLPDIELDPRGYL